MGCKGTKEGNNGKDRNSERMPVKHDALGQTLGSCRADEILPERLNHAAPQEARNVSNVRSGEGEGGQNERTKATPSADRQPFQPQTENKNQ